MVEVVRVDMIEQAKTQKPDVLAFTANSILTKDGSLVMGRGAALCVRNAFPGVDAILGAKVTRYGGSGGVYRVIGDLFYLDGHPITVAALQVKKHWRIPYSDVERQADFDLFEESMRYMTSEFSDMGWSSIVMNMPLVGSGGQPEMREKILEVIDSASGALKITVCVC